MATNVRMIKGSQLVANGPFAHMCERLDGNCLIDAGELDEGIRLEHAGINLVAVASFWWVAARIHRRFTYRTVFFYCINTYDHYHHPSVLPSCH
ncbi:hypothetical protein [Methyloglobulus sp.]|uniref:hypothetical protein n=1 Tax=Methyloglobulus sp. TaxID=2518622 RepID=UPI00398A0D3A